MIFFKLQKLRKRIVGLNWDSNEIERIKTEYFQRKENIYWVE